MPEKPSLYIVTTTVSPAILDTDLLTTSPSLWQHAEQFFQRMGYSFRHPGFRSPFLALLPNDRFAIPKLPDETIHGLIQEDRVLFEDYATALPDTPADLVDLIRRVVQGSFFSRGVGVATVLPPIDTIVHFAPQELQPAAMAELAKEYDLRRLEPIIYHHLQKSF